MHKNLSMEAFDLTPALIKMPVEMSFRRDAKQHRGVQFQPPDKPRHLFLRGE